MGLIKTGELATKTTISGSKGDEGNFSIEIVSPYFATEELADAFASMFPKSVRAKSTTISGMTPEADRGRIVYYVEIRRLFLRGARRLRKTHGKTGSIAYSIIETGRPGGDREVLATENEAIATVFAGETVFVQLRRAGKVVGTRVVKVREGGAK